jgi:hypothetical protein
LSKGKSIISPYLLNYFLINLIKIVTNDLRLKR